MRKANGMEKGILNDAEIEAYRQAGFLIPEYRLAAEPLARLQALAEQLVANNVHVGDPPMVCPHVPGGGAQGLKGDRAWLEFPTDPTFSTSWSSSSGQMVLFDVFTIRGSEPNPSDRQRLGYAMRYMPATSHFDHAAAERREQPSSAHHTRPLFLLCGIDRCAKNDFTIGHPDRA